ncbi:MAG: glutamine synthetase [SAR202 cluster bacterium]|mgnify:FL=1|jgi:glutamine synthetase|nr:MAG: glutamine synthetase [SAR202 cluster bacterium]KAA1303991.1 MAG: glutamine synthetase [SAR202 cluster bacterium]MAR86397.1 glutamine synthetase [Chloroflexota bacterium]MEE3345475.1 glutamine synthetase GlnII [Chloroflexota bacterium]|tara:strand:+ start:894 stop:1889 length:996 start_codon:yes stop_codon:yes gene_type:complete
MAFKAEYIWIDGTEPSPSLRSKTRILPDGSDFPIWGFDGSSTNQAPGENSDCVLRPVFSCPDPISGGNNKLVMCEVLLPNMTPHPTNNRAACAEVAAKFEDQESWFGIEQEYTLFEADGKQPIGFPDGGFPEAQGPYYCSVGANHNFGRDISEAHATACIDAGLGIAGTNAEVMPGQWEFQIGPLSPLDVSDQLWLARWLLHRVAEDYDVVVSIDPKPVSGDWNGAGCHTNFSTKAMRESYQPIIDACEALGKNINEHIENYGVGNDKRLTGLHETQRIDQFSYGVSDRGASIRIPWQVEVDQKGYLEDRRPASNMDPYLVTKLLVQTTCG